MLLLHLLFFFASFKSFSEAYNIVFLIPVAGKSHKIIFDEIITAMLNKGHHITVFSQHKTPVQSPNLTDIIMHNTRNEEALKYAFDHVGTNPGLFFMSFTPSIVSGCTTILEHPEFKAIINKEQHFDAVVITYFTNECSLMVSSLISKVIIQVAAAPLFPWMHPPVTQPPSFVPNSLWPYVDKMTFLERLGNTFNTIVSRFMYNNYNIKDIENIVWKHYPKALSITEAEKQVSFILLNTDPVLVSPRPSLPNFINIGGIHCKESKPIPKDLDEFVKTSGDNGFILFSLGSNVQSKYLPHEKIKSFLNAFARLKLNVIWKYEDELEDIPNNVLVKKWLPQQDLLGDNRIRLFITHGGLLSLQEAVYHSVPVVGIPIFTDQPGNVARVVHLHIGVLLHFDNITEENVFEAITTILNDKSYATNVERYSLILRNQPEKPTESAIFWIEYAIRHVDEKLLFITNNRFNIFQFYSIDVIILITFLIMITICLSYAISKLIVNKFFHV